MSRRGGIVQGRPGKLGGQSSGPAWSATPSGLRPQHGCPLLFCTEVAVNFTLLLLTTACVAAEPTNVSTYTSYPSAGYQTGRPTGQTTYYYENATNERPGFF